jgi:GNAT superfamily N-acetyltransferase
MGVEIRELPAERWPEAARMAGRAFWTEDYMAPLSDDPLELFSISQGLYLKMDPNWDGAVVLGAFLDEHVVGFAWIQRPGSCWFCVANPEEDTADRVSEVMSAVDATIRKLHVHLPEAHASIGPVAVEKELQRKGLGGRLVEEAYRLASGWEPDTVALDCDERLESFYMGCGFRSFAREPDPWGYVIVGMRRDPS